MKLHSPNKNIMAEINMVPFIDVVLILLIIFMVITPFLMQTQINVELPKSSSKNAVSKDNIIKIEVFAGGKIVVNKRPVKLAGLEQELILLMGKSSEKTILVQADKNTNIQTLVTILDISKKLGASSLGIGVLEKS
ncbi:MAG: biopolymer transporter ExbD [Elusimicrobiaceae bacterium]|jgi:biopolymer transport protein TolR|nr:biopolymer transporter ExbD [Elusimicrobiaceae bacterium]MBT3955411.1 biopolymer transporter ExbD [Elusimicrobiaceae bacterium]MBT4007688.1 biopolymer transporter ExbD [Elusimicrobiaceae bacterium]MBT4402302.1 biopolymer transporter ExbD [Elusimicrobiaceae bacterium]MBT4439535.1 biopolymer transporter ExbD [Elusimicrobiaceae bacterium]